MGRVRDLKNTRRVSGAQALCTQLTLNKRQLLHWREALRPRGPEELVAPWGSPRKDWSQASPVSGCAAEVPCQCLPSSEEGPYAKSPPSSGRPSCAGPRPAVPAFFPAEAQPASICHGPPGELWLGSRRQLPPPLAAMSSSGSGNF